MMTHLQRRAMLMRQRSIALVLDVGANAGQYALALRTDVNYRGRIVSFEPLPDAFALLERNCPQDPLWSCRNIALGDFEGTAMLNMSANSHSSSFLQASERSLQLVPSIQFVGAHMVQVRRLDRIFHEFARPGEAVFLKVDTQGFEMNVLNGAASVLQQIALVQLETSFFQAYKGEALAGDVIKFMQYLGFRIVSFEPEWEDPRTGELLQGDFLFARG